MIVLVVVCLLCSALFIHVRSVVSRLTPNRSIATVVIHGKTLRLVIAQDSQSWTQGLGGVVHLDDQSGMVFLFPSSETRMFWNKGMLIDFDLLWIQASTIVGIVPSIPMERSGLETVTSPQSVDTVIELPSGWTRRNALHVGERVSFVHLP